MTNLERITKSAESLAQAIAGARYMGVGYTLECLEQELTGSRELFDEDQYEYLMMLLGVQRLRNGLKQAADVREWSALLHEQTEESE